MTIDEIKQSDKRFLTPDDIKDYLEADPQSIRVQAHNDPSKLGFPVVVLGSRVKIPRKGFLKFFELEE